MSDPLGFRLEDRERGPHGREVACLQRGEGPGEVGVEACGRVAEILGEFARLAGPSPAELEGLGHADRLVGKSYRVDQRGVVARAPRRVDRLGRQRQALVEAGVVGALEA